jgi:hypothetical protein
MGKKEMLVTECGCNIHYKDGVQVRLHISMTDGSPFLLSTMHKILKNTTPDHIEHIHTYPLS